MERPIYEQLEMPEENRFTNNYVPITKEEAEFIYTFLKGKRASVTLEVGLAYGCSAAHIIAATKTKHCAIDPFQNAFNNLGLINIKKLNFDSYLNFKNEFSHNVLPKLVTEGMKIDFAFIDGGHKFDEIFLDFYYVDLLLNQNGYVLFHDAWMRSTQMVASWIRNNKVNYALIKTPMENLILFQKTGKDNREWYHFKEFVTFKSFIKFRKILRDLANRKIKP